VCPCECAETHLPNAFLWLWFVPYFSANSVAPIELRSVRHCLAGLFPAPPPPPDGGVTKACQLMFTLRTSTVWDFGLKNQPESAARSISVTDCEPMSASAPAYVFDCVPA